MTGRHDPSESHDYRPKSPDLSQFTQPHPPPARLSRIPSNPYPVNTGHLVDSSHPSSGITGYSFSPRGSYDASPYFSPQTTSPSSYFPKPHAPPPQQQQQHYSPQSFRTPNQPQFQPPQPQPHLQSQASGRYFNQQSPEYSSHQDPRSYPPGYQSNIAHHHQEFQYPPQQALTYTQPGGQYDDMARTRSSRNTNDADYRPTAQAPPPIKSEPIQQIQPQAPPAPMDPTLGIDVRTKFPVARIKRIMQADEDVGKVAQATPTAVSKALELFMIALVSKGAEEARASHSKRVTAQHLKTALMNDGQFDFLTDICENIPEEGSKKGRAKSEPRTDSDEEGLPKKKPKGSKKKKADTDDDTD
ncbi:hypothetical protein B0A52_04096 [Exophiala mesophila]|uniref:Transcription factor CBF/NF-Y/archaeal histone domain-containing protein n=1 Tax=Exophiala mesophila TaxID=212818 RepID=A0A438NAA4_EXOME|nr:hypothetical protein B0A52_04096 [Exophiala mesophila]